MYRETPPKWVISPSRESSGGCPINTHPNASKPLQSRGVSHFSFSPILCRSTCLWTEGNASSMRTRRLRNQRRQRCMILLMKAIGSGQGPGQFCDVGVSQHCFAQLSLASFHAHTRLLLTNMLDAIWRATSRGSLTPELFASTHRMSAPPRTAWVVAADRKRTECL